MGRNFVPGRGRSNDTIGVTILRRRMTESTADGAFPVYVSEDVRSSLGIT